MSKKRGAARAKCRPRDGSALSVEFFALFGKDLWILLPTALSHEQLKWQRYPAALPP